MTNKLFLIVSVAAIFTNAFAADDSAIDAAVAHPGRTSEHLERDYSDKPAELLKLVGLEQGWQVADLVATRAYFTEILSFAVGDEGHVYGVHDAWVQKNAKHLDDILAEKLAGLDNASVVHSEYASLHENVPPLDAVLLNLFYHDFQSHGDLDRDAINRSVFAALKPGGVYIIVDHRAEIGSGDRDQNTLHRIDANFVKAQIEMAGFVLETDSPLHANPDDTLKISVFDDTIRRRTDRFVHIYKKPIEGQ